MTVSGGSATAALPRGCVSFGAWRVGDAIVWLPGLASLLVMSVLMLWFPLLRATEPSAIAYNEGWNTYWQQAAAAGRGLYAAPPGLTIENYPPLSFQLVGFLGGLTGDTNMAGRVVALLSLCALAVVAGVLAGRVSGSHWAAWYAALSVLVYTGVYAPDRIAMNDPQLLGMVPEFLGLYVFVRWRLAMPGLVASAVLFAVAVFTKQNLIAFPLAVGAVLLVGREWRALAVWVGTGLAAAVVLTAVSVAVDGPFLFDHLLRSRALDYATGRNTVIGYGLRFTPGLLMGGAWTWRHIARPGGGRVLAAAWMVATALGVVLAFGHGVANNILFEAMMLGAVIVPVACESLGDQGVGAGTARARMARCCLMTMNVLWPVVFIPVPIPGPHAWDGHARAAAAFRAGIQVLRDHPGPAWCEDLLICDAAGKAMVFDAYFAQDQIETGRLPECEVLRRLSAQVPAAVEIGAPSDRDAPSPAARLRFTGRFMETLMRYYGPVLRTRDFTILAPRLGPWVDEARCAEPASRPGGRN